MHAYAAVSERRLSEREENDRSGVLILLFEHCGTQQWSCLGITERKKPLASDKVENGLAEEIEKTMVLYGNCDLPGC